MPGTRRIELPVAGVTCQKCVQAVERALLAVPGVGHATVNLVAGRAFAEYDPGQTTVAALHGTIKAAGYRSESGGSGQWPAIFRDPQRKGRADVSNRGVLPDVGVD